jgi:hypothetical protein
LFNAFAVLSFAYSNGVKIFLLIAEVFAKGKIIFSKSKNRKEAQPWENLMLFTYYQVVW